MTRIKSFYAVAFAILCFAATASAQTEEKQTLVYPQLFVGVQGGAQTTLADYNNWKLVTPTASVSLGAFFTPVVGARLHFNGIWNKGGYYDRTDDFQYKYRYLTSNIDLMINMVTLLGNKYYYPLNFYLIGGVGLNYAWDNGEAFARIDKLPLAYEHDRFSHNARVGAMFDYNLSKHISVNLEVTANSLNDRYNSRMSDKSDWQFTAQLGVTYKFAAKRKKAATPVTESVPAIAELATATSMVDTNTEEIWKTRKDTIWYYEDDITTKVENASATWNVFYGLDQSNFKANEQLAAIGAFLKEHRECKVDIKSYSDEKTGNSNINMEISKQRCEKAVKALTDAGVPVSSITSSYYGDTIQPFAENDKNRVSIIVATGLKDVSQKSRVKKYKTKDVRYRVK